MIKRSTLPHSAILISLALIACLFAACGDDDDASQGETQTSEAAAAADEASLPEPITVDGAKRVDLQDRLLTELEIPEGPDWMVEAFGSLWVKQDSGDVTRVDPETGEVLARIQGSAGDPRPHGRDCQGIGASEEAVWSCPREGTVARIDPATSSVAATIRIDKFADQGRLVSAADRVWVLTDSGEELTGIDTRTDKPATTVELGGRCLELAASDTTLWATCPLEDRLLRIDAKTGEISDELGLAGATNAAVGDQLWVGFEGGLAQIDPKTLEVLAVYELSPRYGGSIFATPDAVWVREEGERFVSRIDPEAQRIVETIEAPELPSGGDVVQIEHSVWATAYDDATLVELKASP
jgi:streptogramin lyase